MTELLLYMKCKSGASNLERGRVGETLDEWIESFSKSRFEVFLSSVMP